MSKPPEYARTSFFPFPEVADMDRLSIRAAAGADTPIVARARLAPCRGANERAVRARNGCMEASTFGMQARAFFWFITANFRSNGNCETSAVSNDLKRGVKTKGREVDPAHHCEAPVNTVTSAWLYLNAMVKSAMVKSSTAASRHRYL